VSQPGRIATGRARHSARGGAGLGAALLLLVGFVGLLAYGLASSGRDDSLDSRLGQGRAAAAPGFELPVLERGELGPLAPKLAPALRDRRVALSELRGVPLVLNFWASWCPPCRSETPLLERTWRRVRPDGVLMLGLNMQDLTDEAREFLREFDVSYPNVRDQADEVASDWGVAALPESFFIDARSRVVGHVIGALSPSSLRAGVAAARSGRPLGARSGGDRRPAR
jgi:cytochrome c biogenesis protein CcmG, thiol:disulfide interchange protein DsbE